MRKLGYIYTVLWRKSHSFSRLQFRLGTSKIRGQPPTGKPTEKKTITIPQASHNNYHLTLIDTQTRRRQTNTSTKEHTGAPETTGVEIASGHTHSSVSDNESDNAAMTETKKRVPQRTISETENNESRLESATLNLNKNHRMLYIPIKI